MEAKHILTHYYDGLARKQGWEDVIADDFAFTGGDMSNRKPVVGKQAYIDVLNRFSRLFTSMRVVEIFTKENNAFALVSYDYVFPNGKIISGEVAEYWQIKHNKLAGLTIYFDTLNFYRWTGPLPVVMKYYLAWTQQDYQQAASYLADTLEIIVPIHHYPDKTSFMKAVAQTRGMIKHIDLVASFSEANSCMLLYDMELVGFGKLRVAEYFRISKGKIVQLCQVHDTLPFRKPSSETSIN